MSNEMRMLFAPVVSITQHIMNRQIYNTSAEGGDDRNRTIGG